MERQYILIIFESNNVITDDDIYSAGGINKKFCDIITLNDLLKDTSIMKEYNLMLDCTFDNKFYNKYKNNKKGTEIKAEFNFIKTARNKIILAGPNISQLTAAKYSNSPIILDKVKNDIRIYEDKVQFLIKKEPKLVNILNYEKGIKEGIEVNHFIPNGDNKKRYILIDKIPENKNENIVYILPEDIRFLESFIKIADKII